MSNLPPYPGGSDEPGGESGRPDGGTSEQSWGATPPQSPYGEQQAPPPYGQQPTPYGQQPAGQQPPYGQSPYGQDNPYGQGQWGGPGGGYGAYQGPNDAAGQSYSGLAIAALVLSFTCLLSWLGVILGIAALFKTGRGKAKGLWMAVTAIIVGLILTAILASIAAFALWIGNQFVTPDNAEVGQCVEVDSEGRDVTLFKTDCAEPHNGQIFAVHELSDSDIDDLGAQRTGQVEFCVRAAVETFDVAPATSITVDGEEMRIEAVLDAPEDPEAGDEIVCLIETRSGTIDRSLVD